MSSFAIDAHCSMFEKLFRNWIKGLTGKELGLSNLTNMASVAFYQIVCTKVSIVTLLIWSKYWKKLQRNGRTDRNASDGF